MLLRTQRVYSHQVSSKLKYFWEIKEQKTKKAVLRIYLGFFDVIMLKGQNHRSKTPLMDTFHFVATFAENITNEIFTPFSFLQNRPATPLTVIFVRVCYKRLYHFQLFNPELHLFVEKYSSTVLSKVRK